VIIQYLIMGTPAQMYRNQCIVALYESGKLTQQEVAKVFQVSQGLISQIYARYRQEGAVGLQGSFAPGASAKLTDTQRERLGTLLDQGATAQGFEGERWTRKRVRRVIEQEFGVTYEVSSVGRLLREMGFSRQKPVRKDHRQKETAVTTWKTARLPGIKKRRTGPRA
jgi:transposase